LYAAGSDSFKALSVSLISPKFSPHGILALPRTLHLERIDAACRNRRFRDDAEGGSMLELIEPRFTLLLALTTLGGAMIIATRGAFVAKKQRDRGETTLPPKDARSGHQPNRA
jgi:hypothetical protein